MTEDKQYPIVDQPKNFTRKLMDHQLTAIYKMQRIEKNRKLKFKNRDEEQFDITTDISIFGDPIGCGKTLAMIGLIANDEMVVDENDLSIITFETSSYESSFVVQKKIFISKENLANTTLVVASNIIISQWEKEIDTTDLKYLVIDTVKKCEMYDIKTLSQYKIVLCTATMYKHFQLFFDQVYWKRFVIDEADSLRIPNMQRPRSKFTWFVTSTPEALCGSKGQSWIAKTFSKFSHLLPLITIKNDAKYVEKSKAKFSNVPDYIEIVHRPLKSAVTKTIALFVDKNIIDMMEAGDIAGSIEALGGKVTNANIIDVVCEKFQKELEDAEKHFAEHNKRTDEGGKKLAEEWKSRIKEREKKIKNLKERFTEEVEKTECSVCSNIITNPTLISCCQNVACASCFLYWMKDKTAPSCMFCRAPAKENNLIYLSKEKVETKEQKQEIPSRDESKFTKQDIITFFALEHPKSKILVFSDREATAKILFDSLKTKNIKCNIVNGSKATKIKRIKEYNDGVTNVLFINSRENGAGINLPLTTDVFIFHNMSKEIQKQAIGRAQRIGRTDQLRVHFFE